MIIAEHIKQFYLDNGISKDGGENDDWFVVKILFFTVMLPNPSWRKKVIHMHDIHHLLNNCGTSWAGEGVVAGWEIATGWWKAFPVCLYVFVAMAFSIYIRPLAVYRGYTAGLNSNSTLTLGLDKDTIYNMELSDLKEMLQKPGTHNMQIGNWMDFIFWNIIGQIVLLLPLASGLYIFLLIMQLMGFDPLQLWQ